jgi:hypothetical protein
MSYYAPDPLKIEDPKFECNAPNEYALEASIALSRPESGDKYDRYCTLTFRTDNMGGYPMSIAVQLQDQPKDWHTADEVGAVTIRFRGDYEADILREFFQHVGRMATVVYGPVTQYNNGENDD